jgi:hypothetical protein
VTDSSTRSRAVRLIGGALAGVLGLGVLALFCVAGLAWWMFAVTLPNHQDDAIDNGNALSRQRAAALEPRLTAAAADGKLSDAELDQVVRRRWLIRRTAAEWQVVVRFQSNENLCFRYDMTLPLGPGTRVTWTELPTCPDFTAPQPSPGG